MRLLLDTHVFLWYISGDARLPAAWGNLVRDPANTAYLSAISIWEAGIKYHLGKLPLPSPPEIYLPHQRKRHAIDSLPLEEADLSPLHTLPPLHRDPFDRALICQAIVKGLTLVTADEAIRAYPVELLAPV
jgi:PIN domain nuclease of toxin-antitoxin system